MHHPEAHQVNCPKCRTSYGIHHDQVKVLAGPQHYAINSKGFQWVPGEPEGRGVMTRLGFVCESCNGHFEFVFHFEKGIVSAWCEMVTAEPSEEEKLGHDIWRD